MKSATLDQGLFRFAIPPHRRGSKRTKDSGVPHGSRPVMKPENVAHVTVKLKGGLPPLRVGQPFQMILAAIDRVKKGGRIRIVDYSLQSNHVHLIVEASSSADLSSGMASLNTGMGMRLNRFWNRTGQGSASKETL